MLTEMHQAYQAGLPCPSGMVFIISVQGPGALEGYTHTEG